MCNINPRELSCIVLFFKIVYRRWGIFLSYSLNLIFCVMSLKNSLFHSSNCDLSVIKGKTSCFACSKSIVSKRLFNIDFSSSNPKVSSVFSIPESSNLARKWAKLTLAFSSFNSIFPRTANYGMELSCK